MPREGSRCLCRPGEARAVSELAEFLLARIAEDEFGANRADGGRIRQAVKVGRGTPIPDISFVSRHNPERVLAECEAKRHIVGMGGNECGTQWDEESAAEYRRITGQDPTQHYPTGYAPGCDGCSAAESLNQEHETLLRTIAAIYADHRDFREEWGP